MLLTDKLNATRQYKQWSTPLGTGTCAESNKWNARVVSQISDLEQTNKYWASSFLLMETKYISSLKKTLGRPCFKVTVLLTS